MRTAYHVSLRKVGCWTPIGRTFIVLILAITTVLCDAHLGHAMVSLHNTSEEHWNSSKAPALLKPLFIKTMLPMKLTDWRLNEAVSAGEPAGHFNASCKTAGSTTNSTGPDKAPTCFTDSAYNERLIFYVKYMPRNWGTNWTVFLEPQLSYEGTKGNFSLQSTQERNFTDGTSVRYVTVLYNCKKDESTNATVTLRMNFRNETSKESLTLQWRKTCHGGKPTEVELGYELDHASHAFPQNTSKLVVFSPSVVSTDLYLMLHASGAQMNFAPPYLTAFDKNVVSVSVRGNHPRGGLLIAGVRTSMQVVYECNAKGSSAVSMTIGLAPFSNITAVWTKGKLGTRACAVLARSRNTPT